MNKPQYQDFIPHFKGYWKFTDSHVEVEELIDLAKEWAEDDNFISLHVRKTSDDQHGIGFEYKDPAGGGSKEMREFKERMTDSLKRRFGNGFVGWDVSSSFQPIK